MSKRPKGSTAGGAQSGPSASREPEGGTSSIIEQRRPLADEEGAASMPNEPTAAEGDEKVSREEVIMAWRLLLGREPESDLVIETHRVDTLESLRVVLLKSTEFAQKYRLICEKPEDSRKK